MLVQNWCPSSSTKPLHKRSKGVSIKWIRDGDLDGYHRGLPLHDTLSGLRGGEKSLFWQKIDDDHSQKAKSPDPPVSEHNKYMGGQNTSDQMLGADYIHRKAMRGNTTVL